MRGVVPNGVTAPLGATRVTIMPGTKPRRSASLAPRMTESPSSKPSSAPEDSVEETVVSFFRSSVSSPRTSAPKDAPSVFTRTWPSMIGVAFGAQIAPRHHPFETGKGSGKPGHDGSFYGESLGIVLRNPTDNTNVAIWSL